MTTDLLAPILTRKRLENTYRYGGGLISVLLTAEETGGLFSMWESIQRPGAEPPLHVHHNADETFVVLEGHMRFMVADEIIDAPAGSVVFAPRGIPHTFRIQSEYARAITTCTPGGFEEWFQALGEPATSLELPAEMAPAGPPDVPKILALAAKLQVALIRDVTF